MKRFAAVILALAMALSLSGCLIRSTDELYALPKQSDAYLDLQNAIDTVIPSDAQYSSPVSGSNQQPVQMSDLDGDGEDEAIVFVKTGDASPLKAYIFDRRGEHYENICVIEGDGSAFARVEYAQLDGADGMEIVIGRQVSDQVLQSVSAYRLAQGQPEELMSASYSEFTIADLDGDGSRDIFLLRYGMEDQPGVAALYRCVGGEMEREPEVPHTLTAENIRYLIACSLTDDARAIVASRLEETQEIVTEIFTLRAGAFTRISTRDDLGLFAGVVHGYNVLPADVDNDGHTEFPDVVELPSAGQDEDGTEETFHAIRWYRCEPGRKPVRTVVTYHNFASGWYVTIPEQLGTNFRIVRAEGVAGGRGLAFYAGRSGTAEEDLIFAIYAFTGSDRSNLAASDGRFPVGTKGEITYSARLGGAAQRSGVTQDTVVEMFHFIRVDWNSGERHD